MKHLTSNLHRNRRFLYCLLAAVLFFGCTPDEQYIRHVQKSNNVVEYKGYEIETIEYDGHDYIICRDVRGGWHAVSIVHSASCKKCSGH